MKKIFLTLLFIGITKIVLYAENSKWYYTYELNNVECNDNSIIGNIQNNMVSGLYVNTFQDSLIKIDFEFESTHIRFELQNLEKKSLKINWNDMMLYIGGVNHSVFHEGIIIKDRNNEKLPTTVMKGLSHRDKIIACDKVRWDNYFGRYVYQYLLQKEIGDNSLVKILFPIEINDKIYEYVFDFTAKYHKKKIKIKFTSDDMVDYVSVKE